MLHLDYFLFTIIKIETISQDGYMGQDGERGQPGEPGQKGECLRFERN